MAKKQRREQKGKKGKASRFTYKPRSKEQVQRRASQQSGAFDSITKEAYKTFKVQDGKNRVRILPPTWDGAEHYGLDMWVHWSIGPDKQSYLCPSKHGKGNCPLCEEEMAAKRSGDSDYAREIGAKKRVLVWVIDRDNDSEGPMLWAMPWTMDRDISSVCQTDDGDVLLIDNPDEGYDISFSREGKGVTTKYVGIQVSRRESPISDDPDEQSEWLDYIVENPLPECLNFYSYDHINEQFAGGKDSDDDEDEDEDESPKRSKKPKSKAKAKAKQRDTVDPEDVDDMDEDDLEEVIEDLDLDVDLDDYKTIKKKRKAVADALEAMQDDDDDDDEDDEDSDDADDDNDDEDGDADDDDDDDGDDDDEDSDDADEDDDDEDDEDDEEDEEEEERPKKKSRASSVKQRLSKVSSKRKKK